MAKSSMFVYVHAANTQVKCSSVGIKEWDSIGIITHVPTDIPQHPTLLDLEPFFKDNLALASTRKDDDRLQAIYSGKVQANDSGKYSWYVSQSVVDWKEGTWVTRLFHCLKEHDKDMGVEIVNISQRGPAWEEWLWTIFFPTLATSCTIFKGVSDIVLLGKNGFVNVVTMEDVYTCLVDLVSVVFVVEVGVDKRTSHLCDRSGLRLPNKLGELISSTYSEH